MAATADLIQRGMQHHTERRFHEAWWCYEAALEQEPDSPFVWIARGDLANDLMRFNDALSCYDRALASAPGTPKIIERRARTEQNQTAPSGGMLRNLFGGAPKWTPAVASFTGEPTMLDEFLRTSEFGEPHAMMRRICALWDDIPDSAKENPNAYQALLEQRSRPSAFQSVVDDVLRYKLRRAEKMKEAKLDGEELEIKRAPATEELLRRALESTYSSLLMSDTPKKLDAYTTAHTDFMRVEVRYPGLAEAIWAVRGRGAFEKGRLGAALASDRESLARFHDLAQRDPTALVEAVLAWLG